MSDQFKAILLRKDGDKVTAAVEQVSEDMAPALPEGTGGDVRVKIDYSTVNFKDGLVLSGSPLLAAVYPMVPGIDYSGTVESSDDPKFKAGDRVVQNGWGVGDAMWGGYGEKALSKGGWLVKLPDNIDNHQAMVIGTGGYTAMLCILALEDAGVTPDSGPVLVTGAAGGVGSVSVAILSQLGYEVIASTGRPEEEEFLKSLGASSIIERASLSEPGRPLGAERWAGVVDSVGSHTLVNALAQTKYLGAVSACGLAQGADLPGTVMPFLLRGVSLLGIDSVMCPMARREQAYARMATDLSAEKMAIIGAETRPLEGALEAGKQILQGKIRGRVVIDVNA
jgi:acrylyl-CoA reductase (NADPH)